MEPEFQTLFPYASSHPRKYQSLCVFLHPDPAKLRTLPLSRFREREVNVLEAAHLFLLPPEPLPAIVQLQQPAHVRCLYMRQNLHQELPVEDSEKHCSHISATDQS